MNEENKQFSIKRTLSSDTQKLLLRIALGFVFIIAGFKITFPADASADASSTLTLLLRV